MLAETKQQRDHQGAFPEIRCARALVAAYRSFIPQENPHALRRWESIPRTVVLNAMTSLSGLMGKNSLSVLSQPRQAQGHENGND